MMPADDMPRQNAHTPTAYAMIARNLCKRCLTAVRGLADARERLEALDDDDPLPEGLRNAVVALMTFSEWEVINLVEHLDKPLSGEAETQDAKARLHVAAK